VNPVCFKIGAVTVHWYGVLMAAGFAAGLANWVVLGRREGRNYTYCADLLFWIMVAGLVGARAAYVLTEWGEFRDDPLSVFAVWRGGLIYYGGFAGALAAIVVFARRGGESAAGLFDFVVTSVPLGHALGRVGCFLNGCCFGAVHAGAAAVRYPAQSYPWLIQVHTLALGREEAHGLPVHPVQLYEAGFNLALAAVLNAAYRRRHREGGVAALYLLLYAPARFLLESLRGDPRAHWLGLSVGRLVSLVLAAVGAAAWAWSRRRGREVDRGR